MQDPQTRHALVFALAHEIGNQLAGIRLEAHLLDEGLGPAGLARASLAIEGLAGQAAPLLALLRPLLAPGSRRDAGPTCAAVLEAVRRELETEGAAGRPIVVDLAGADETARAVRGIEGLHALLRALIGVPAELGAPGEPIRLALARTTGGIAVACALPGAALVEAVEAGAAPPSGGGPEPGPSHALRGRALACAIARVLLADAGGHVEVRLEAGRSHVALHLPV